MDNSIQQRITLFFDNALEDTDRKDLLNQVNNDPSYQKMFEKEQHLREIIKTKLKRPSVGPDLIQSIKDNFKIQ